MPDKNAVPIGHNPVTYPKEVPTHCVGHLINYFRGTEEIPTLELVQHGTTIVGCSAELAKGLSPTIGAASPYGDPATMSKTALADAMEDGMKQVTAPQAGDTAAAIPPWLMSILVEAALRIFNEWFKPKT